MIFLTSTFLVTILSVLLSRLSDHCFNSFKVPAVFLAHSGVANDSTLSAAAKTSNSTRKTNFTLNTEEMLHTSSMRDSSDDEAARINTAATVTSSNSNSSNTTGLQCCSEGGVPDGEKPNPKHTKKVLLHIFFLNEFRIYFSVFS